jgi:hypothetical protein
MAWQLLEETMEVEMEKPPARLVCHSQLKGWLLDWIGKMNGRVAATAMMLIYNLWQARNDARESKRIEDPRNLVKKTLDMVEEWFNTHCNSTPASTRTKERWTPPCEGWHKVNVDGAFHSADGVGGGGVVVRDHHGSFVAGACHFFPALAGCGGG